MDPRDVTRPTAAPDHSDARDTTRVTPPLREDDRVAWVRREFIARGGRRAPVERDVDHLGSVAALERVGDDVVGVWLYLDELGGVEASDAVYAPIGEVFPRPGR